MYLHALLDFICAIIRCFVLSSTGCCFLFPVLKVFCLHLGLNFSSLFPLENVFGMYRFRFILSGLKVHFVLLMMQFDNSIDILWVYHVLLRLSLRTDFHLSWKSLLWRNLIGTKYIANYVIIKLHVVV